MKTWRPSNNPDDIDPSMDPAFLEIIQSLNLELYKRITQKLKHINLMVLKLKLNIGSPISSPPM